VILTPSHGIARALVCVYLRFNQVGEVSKVLILIGQTTRFFGFKNTHYTLAKSLDHVVTTLCVSFPANLSGFLQDQNVQYAGQAGQVAAI